MLIIDDLRPDLGAYGHRGARTPNIDALAARSALFMRAHAAVANCAPSRASLLSGLRPDRHGVHDLVTHVRDTVPHVVTLPQRFRQAGYLSVGYGKIFHQKLDDSPSWSTQAEFADANHSYRGLRGEAWVRAGGWKDGWRYDQYRDPANVRAQRQRDRKAQPLYSVVPPHERGPADDAPAAGTGCGVRPRAPCPTTDARLAGFAVAALRRLRVQPRPWFLAVGFIRPHLPFNAPAPFFDAAAPPARADPAEPPAGASRLTRAHVADGHGELFSFRGAAQLARKQPWVLQRAYAACVSYADAQARRGPRTPHAPPGIAPGSPCAFRRRRRRRSRGAGAARACAADAWQVGRVLAALGRGALAQRTAVALLSDHGWKLGEHGAWGKQ